MPIHAELFQLSHPDGVLRLSTLGWDWTDPEGRTWLGGANVLSWSARGATAAEDGGSFTVIWNGATEALLAAALDSRLQRTPAWAASVTLDDDGQTRTAGPFNVWAGMIDPPKIIADPANPSIEITVNSYLLDLRRARPTRLSQRAVRERDADDTGGDWIDTLADFTPDFRSKNN